MAGDKAPLSAEQGSDTIVWLGLNEKAHLENGGFYKERKKVEWVSGKLLD